MISKGMMRYGMVSMVGMAGMAWALGMGTYSNSSSLSGEGPE